MAFELARVILVETANRWSSKANAIRKIRFIKSFYWTERPGMWNVSRREMARQLVLGSTQMATAFCSLPRSSILNRSRNRKPSLRSEPRESKNAMHGTTTKTSISLSGIAKRISTRKSRISEDTMQRLRIRPTASTSRFRPIDSPINPN